MTTGELLRDVLHEYLDKTDNTAARLARLSGVPKRTLTRWLSGDVLHPHEWQPLVKVAIALHLDGAQTDRLLRAASHNSVRQLLAQARDRDRALLESFNGHVKFSTAAPFQAPRDLATFVGREDALNTLRQALLDKGQVAIVGVQGMGGVGKSALAAHAAYVLKRDFPDGVLWARLDTSDTLTILGAFASAFDHDVSQYRDIESRATAVRSLLANKRALIVLDNAETSAHVKPLLPPGAESSAGACAVLVTTRNDLSAVDGWTHILLGGFEAESGEAMRLFERYLGTLQAQQHEAALDEIATRLGNLPLALAIVAGLLAWQLRGVRSTAQGRHLVQSLLADLRREEARLSRLQRDDLNVIASFNLSYGALPAQLQQFFAQLGVFGGQDFSAGAAAHVSDLAVAVARERLKLLEARSLVQQASNDRFRLHPLLRDYARERLSGMNGLAEVVVRRSLAFFTASLQSVGDDFKAAEADASNVTHLLENEFLSTRASVMLELSQAFYPFIEARGLFIWAKRLYARACDAAQQIGDDEALTKALRVRAATELRLGEYDDVIEISMRGLDMARRIGDDELAVRFLANIGSAHFGRGHYAEAVRVGEEALALARVIEHPQLIASRLVTIGSCLAQLGQAERGKRYVLEGKTLAAEIGDHVTLLVAVNNLGNAAFRDEQYDAAADLFAEGIELARRVGQRERLALLLINFGNARSILGDYATAEPALTEGLQIAQELAMPWMISVAHCTWADHLCRLQRYEEAARAAMEALSAGERINSDQMIANALFALGKIRAGQGKYEEAHSLGQESRELFASNQPTRAQEVKQWLDELEASPRC